MVSPDGQMHVREVERMTPVLHERQAALEAGEEQVKQVGWHASCTH